MNITKRARRRAVLGVLSMIIIVLMLNLGTAEVCRNLKDPANTICLLLQAAGFFGGTSMFVIMFIIVGYHSNEKRKLDKKNKEHKEEDIEEISKFMKKSVELTNVRQNMLTRGLEALKEADAQGINYPLMAWKEHYEALLEDWKEVDLDRKDFMKRCNRLYGTSFKIHESCDKTKEGK